MYQLLGTFLNLPAVAGFFLRLLHTGSLEDSSQGSNKGASKSPYKGYSKASLRVLAWVCVGIVRFQKSFYQDLEFWGRGLCMRFV